MLANRVRETSTSIGTGAITLDGPVSNFQSFNNAFGVNERFVYWIDNNEGLWETGVGYLSSSNTLIRETVQDNSNGSADPISFTGALQIYCAHNKHSTTTLKHGQVNKRTAMCIGDSLISNGWGGSSVSIQSGTRAWYGWICALLNQRIRIEASFGVGGSRIADIISQYENNIAPLANKPGFVFISAGGNDLLNVPTQETLDYTIASMKHLCERIAEHGSTAIVLVNGALDDTIPDATKALFYDFNVWLNQYASSNKHVITIDGFMCVLDPDSPKGSPRPGMLVDDKHYTVVAAQTIGMKAAKMLANVIPEVETFYSCLNDNRGDYRNLSANATLTGNGGSTTAITGEVANSIAGVSVGSVTVAGSKVPADADDDYPGDWQRLAMSNGGTLAQCALYYISTTGWNVGDELYFQAEVRARNLSEIAAVYLEVRCIDSGGATIYTVRGMGPSSSGTDGDLMDFDGVLRAPNMVIPDGTAQVRAYMYAIANDGATAAAGNFDWRRNELRKIRRDSIVHGADW